MCRGRLGPVDMDPERGWKMGLRIGAQPHGPTNVMQVTFVFDELGDLKAASGYERDVTGVTWGQWRQNAAGNLGGRQLASEVIRYLSERLAAIDDGG